MHSVKGFIERVRANVNRDRAAVQFTVRSPCRVYFINQLLLIATVRVPTAAVRGPVKSVCR